MNDFRPRQPRSEIPAHWDPLNVITEHTPHGPQYYHIGQEPPITPEMHDMDADLTPQNQDSTPERKTLSRRLFTERGARTLGAVVVAAPVAALTAPKLAEGLRSMGELMEEDEAPIFHTVSLHPVTITEEDYSETIVLDQISKIVWFYYRDVLTSGEAIEEYIDSGVIINHGSEQHPNPSESYDIIWEDDYLELPHP